MMEVQEPRLLSVQEFANRVNRTERAVYKAIKAGRIKAIKGDDGSAYQISEEEVHLYGSKGSGTREPVPEPSQEPVHETTSNSSPLLAQVHELIQNGFISALERANDEIRRVERQKIDLELQLRLHRNLLAENAESLIEKQAEGESIRQKAETLTQRVAELEQANALLLEEKNRSWWSKIWNLRRESSQSDSRIA